MNYLLHYNNLIKSRKILNRTKNKGTYYEKHHIIMKSMGGTDNKENLILLTAREHFIAHLLLYRIYKDNKTAYSLYRLCTFNNDKDSMKHINISSRLYEEIKLASAEYSSKNLKNLWNDEDMRKRLTKSNKLKNKGRVHTAEAKLNMSNGQKRRPKRSQELIDSIANKNRGKKRSKETCLLISIAKKGKKLTDISKKNMSNAALNREYKTKYILISPTNETFIFKCLKHLFYFTQEHKLSLHTLRNNINKGKILSIIQNKESTLNVLNWELKLIDNLL